MVRTTGFFGVTVLLNPRRGYGVVDAAIFRQTADYGRTGQHHLPSASRPSRVPTKACTWRLRPSFWAGTSPLLRRVNTKD